MKLLKGSQTDIPAKKAPQGTWRQAHNIVMRGGVPTNEDGVVEVASFLTFTPIGELLLPDNSLLTWQVDDVNNRIVRTKDGIETVVTPFNFGLTKEYPVIAKAKYTNDLDIEVVFSDNFGRPRFITIDKTTGFIQEDQIEDTLLFPKITIPDFELIEVGGGGNWRKGSYQVSIAYRFTDGGFTNWIGSSNPIILRSNGGSFTIKINNIDTNFEEFKIGIIADNDGVVTAEETFNNFTIIGDTKSATLIGGGSTIAIESILVKGLNYNRIGDFADISGTLYASNLSRDTSIDYQQYANNIKIEPIWDDPVALDIVESSYADAIILFDKKHFTNEEIYAFYINWIGMDGIPLGSWHIPMTTGPSTMNLHTNLNERYPSGKGYPETGGIGDPVRHHKFPKTSAADFLITPNSGAANVSSSSGISLVDNFDGSGSSAVAFTSISGTYGVFENDSQYAALTKNTWVAGTTDDIDITIDFKITNTGDDSGAIQVLAEVYSAGDVFIRGEIDRYWVYDGNDTAEITTNATISLNAGEKVQVRLIVYGVYTGIQVTTGIIKISEADTAFGSGAKYFTKPMGIKVSNVVIPQGLLDRVQSFEIMYAKRTPANSSVVAQDIIYPRVYTGSYIADRAKVHDFGLMLDKPSVKPNKLRGQYTLRENSSVTLKYTYVGDTPTLVTVNRNIVSSKYVPHDNVAANNKKGEEHFEVTLDAPYDPTSDSRLLGNIINERDDYYLSLDTQNLVSTGKQHIIPSDTVSPPQGWVWAGNQWTVTIDKLYGGDTITSYSKFKLSKENPGVDGGDTSTLNIRLSTVPTQQKVNSALREWGDIWYEKEPLTYPDRGTLISANIHQDISDNNLNQVTTKAYELSKEYAVYKEIDRGFLAENDKLQVTIQGQSVTEHPHRVIATLEQNKESEISSWRQFKASDYYELNKDRGEITNLAVYDTDKLAIHHERGLFVTAGKEVLKTDISEIFLGSGKVFSRDPKEPIYSEEGFLGSTHKFFNKTTPLGYVFESEGKIFILSKSLEEISKKGKTYHFADLIDGVGDNPYIQNETDPSFVGGMSLSYDKNLNRILVSINKLNASETWSYSLDIGAWIGTHDLTLSKLFNSAKKYYSLAKNKLFRHEANNKCKYYDGVARDHWIELSLVDGEDITKLHEAVLWNDTVIDGNTTLKDETFKSIQIKDSHQDTGERTLVKLVDLNTDHNLRKAFNTWRYNKLRLEAVDYDNRKKFIDDHIIVKLTFDNINQYEHFISDISISYRVINI